jgi:hypothetical protein
MLETYKVTRLPGWTDSQWDEVVDAIEDTVASIGESFEMEEN